MSATDTVKAASDVAAEKGATAVAAVKKTLKFEKMTHDVKTKFDCVGTMFSGNISTNCGASVLSCKVGEEETCQIEKTPDLKCNLGILDLIPFVSKGVSEEQIFPLASHLLSKCEFDEKKSVIEACNLSVECAEDDNGCLEKTCGFKHVAPKPASPANSTEEGAFNMTAKLNMHTPVDSVNKSIKGKVDVGLDGDLADDNMLTKFLDGILGRRYFLQVLTPFTEFSEDENSKHVSFKHMYDSVSKMVDAKKLPETKDLKFEACTEKCDERFELFPAEPVTAVAVEEGQGGVVTDQGVVQ